MTCLGERDNCHKIMQLLIRTPTRNYFITIFIIVSALFVTFSAVIHRHYDDAQQLNQWTLYNYEVLRQSRTILLDLVDMETGVRGYLLSGKKSFLEPYESSRAEIAARIMQLREFTKNDAEMQANINQWLKNIETFIEALDNQLELISLNGAEGFSQDRFTIQKLEMDSLRFLIESYIKTRMDALKTQLDVAGYEQRQFKYTLIIGTVLAVGGMLLATMVMLALIRRSQKAEEETRLVENRCTTIMNSVNDGLYDYNTSTKHIYYSPAYKAMLGYTDEEHPNTIEVFRELLHPEDGEQSWENLQKYSTQDPPLYSQLLRLRHKDGSWRWVLARGVVIKDAKTKSLRLVGTHTDITEQKLREEELKQLTADMENFAYITSHDLRAPLVNMKGFANEMRHAVTEIKPIVVGAEQHYTPEQNEAIKRFFDEDIPESLRFIEQSVERMDALTTAVLDLSRIGKREYRFEPVDTQTIIGRIIDSLSYEISKKEIEVVVADMPTIMSDPLAFEQMFSNLLDNAVKYQHPERKGLISISAEENKTQYIFCVQDNGRGIAEEDRPRIFQIFRRARNSSDVRGLGMGMTFVQATVRRLGGSIWFESTEGVGTTFYLRLPKTITKGTKK